MFYDTSASHHPPRASLLSIAYRSWQMIAGVLIERRTYAKLSRLDDRLLKDIGISRGNIRSSIRHGRPVW